MTTRELFEAEFPVPSGVVWNGHSSYAINRSLHDGTTNLPEIYTHYKAKWIGFQAGVKAAGGVK